jgi:2-C-methyl-D-erythritol 2,4-cyclodiphosphate synthase
MTPGTPLPRLRVGQGFDVHPLVEGRELVLGGVRVPFERGLGGHSDADVVAHAACEALLSAAGLGDMGQHYPPGDPRWAGVSSLEFCRDVAKRLAADGWTVENLAVTVVCDRPRLGQFVPEMRQTLAGALDLDQDRLQVTPKSSEGLGFTGRGEGIAAIAACLLAGWSQPA